MLKRLFSYFVPVNIYRKSSSVSQSIEVTWNNGHLVLDSKNTNYSYGSLQRILRKGLKNIGLENIADMKHILVLGVAGGSVIKTLVEEAGYKDHITGVEIDAEIIAVANTWFKLDEIENLEIIIDDASEFVLKTEEKYDLIIIDVFQDQNMPYFLFDSSFANRIGSLLNTNGYILFNTMTLNGEHDSRNKQYIARFDPVHFKIESVPRLENHNELIIIQKLV
jgi:spermidine synthase